MNEDSDFTTWGLRGLRVRCEVGGYLESVRLHNPGIGNLLWISFSQGVGNAPLSAGTHLQGWAGDFSFKAGLWTRANSLSVAHSLIDAFAVAFRHEGELGAGSPAHLHIAWKGQSNSEAILAAQAQEGPFAIRAAIDRCFRV